jgi:SAM-dependent methyltransferase
VGAGVEHRGSDAILDREREFHDALAAAVDAAEMPPPGHDRFHWPVERSILEALGDVRGKRVLDLGCGYGDLTFRLLEAGAEVVGLDLSPGSIEVARARIGRFAPGATVEFVAAPAERTGLPDGSFDLIAGKWILHHLDSDRVAPELTRLLRPGGRAVFAETWGGNRLLMFARRHIAGRFGVWRWGTADEQPLSRRDINHLAGPFGGNVSVDHPYMMLAMNLMRFRRVAVRPRLIDRLIDIDEALHRVRPLRRWSYIARIVFSR